MRTTNSQPAGTSLRHAPKIREVYWFSPPSDLEKQEFPGKRRLVVILSRKSRLDGTVTVVPITTSNNQNERESVKIESPIDGRDCWVICNHVMTWSTRRLQSQKERKAVLKITDADFQQIVARIYSHLPEQRLSRK